MESVSQNVITTTAEMMVEIVSVPQIVTFAFLVMNTVTKSA